jgi:serine/threonine-protein kinase
MDLVNESPRVLGNRYEVGDLLGRGGMAEVHLGRDTRLGRTVAIKLLRVDLARDPTFQARFRREAQSAASLNHPAIVAVYDTGEEQIVDAHGGVVALPYIVMEYVEGKTLRDLLVDGNPIDIGYALDITAGVLSALEYSHRAGIVHRDIKPGNVMIGPDHEIKVMDFGIARAMADATATMTQTQAVIGTAQYLSPEQARGETVDSRSDLYSAGCLLFELITGRPPFVAESPVAVAYQHVREEPRAPSTYNHQIPDSVDRVVLHSLAKDREHRYQSAAEFRADVEAARQGRRVSAVAANASNAATEYLPSSSPGTQVMAGEYGSMLPGGPPEEDLDYGYDDRRDNRKKRSPAWGYVLLAGAVVLVFGLIFFGVSQLIGGSEGQKVTVPNVQGMPQEQAETALDDLGLVPATTQTPSKTVEKGRVISQDPGSGVLVAQNSTVDLVVSSGPDTVVIPDLSGKTENEATNALTDLGLTVGRITEQSDPSVAKDVVIKTSPVSGTNVDKGSSVDLYISNGQVEVPDVVGLSLQEATQRLADMGLEIATNFESSSEPVNTVIDQDYRNARVDQGSTVTVTVSEGLDPTPDPPVSTTPPTDPPTTTTTTT